jgi:hypothetical protein
MAAEVRRRSGWGEYQSYVEDALESCLDYAGRLQRSLRGDIAPDRHYFLSKADALQEAATRLLACCEDVESLIEADGQGLADES